MISTLISFDRSVRRLSSLALIGTAVLAACDDSETTGPKPAAIPTAASPIISVAKPGTLRIMIFDQNGTAPTTVGAQFTVALAGGPALFLVDNGTGDTDPTDNVLRMTGLLGTYTVCQTVAPTDYVLPTPACQSVVVGVGSSPKMQFINKTVGLAQWSVLGMDGMPVGDAVFVWHDSIGISTVVADNSARDLDKTPGRFLVKAPYGSGGACPLTAPKYWIFPGNPGCFGIPVPPGQITAYTNVNASPEYSAHWHAWDPNGYAGPSEYTITALGGGFSAVVVDNGVNDKWQDLGKMWVQLPAGGDYEICQTKSPANTLLADPVCLKVTLTFGDPTYSGHFISQWK
jgi:hypothetical protein